MSDKVPGIQLALCKYCERIRNAAMGIYSRMDGQTGSDHSYLQLVRNVPGPRGSCNVSTTLLRSLLVSAASTSRALGLPYMCLFSISLGSWLGSPQGSTPACLRHHTLAGGAVYIASHSIIAVCYYPKRPSSYGGVGMDEIKEI